MTSLPARISKDDLIVMAVLAVVTLSVFLRVTGFDFINYDDPFFCHVEQKHS